MRSMDSVTMTLIVKANSRCSALLCPGIRDGVRELLGLRTDTLARKFHDTLDMKVTDEIERLAVRAMLTELDKSGLAVP